MLRQYYAARSAAAANGLGPDANWALKERRDAIPSPHVHPMSTRILGVGILLAGVLVLSVALIMGLEFPKYVHTHLREDQCVLQDQHDKFRTWREGTQWTRQVHVYYWHLHNPDHFLYAGAVPQVEQKGPYVYTEYEIREDVTFSVTQATFRVRRRHVFNPEETAKECVYCQENDTVTVLNTEYLREVYKRGGDTDYLLSKLTSSLRSILHSHSLYSAKVLTSNISALGCLDAVCDTNHGDLSPLLNNVSFGHWLRRVDANYSTVIMENGTRESFNASEIGGVYKALLNVSVLGSELTSQGVDGVTLNSQCLLWARSVCSQLPVPASPASSDTCGIVHLLRECGPDSVKLRGVRDMLDAAFCPQDGDMWCLDLTSLHDSVVSAYFEAFRDFVLVQLVKVVHQYVLVQGNRDLVVTRPQSDLALGYNVTDDVHSPVVWRHVQGVLAEDWVKSEDSEGVLWRVDTCLQDRDMDNNMKIREWNGSQFAPTFILRDPNLQVTLTGHTDFVDACYPLVSCQACAAPAESLTLFVPSLWRAVRYTLTGLTSVLGFDVYRYLLSADTFSWDDKYDVNCGLQALTSTLGFVGWLGLPRLNMEMTAKVGSKKVDVEATTGRVWQRQTQLQINVGVRGQDAMAARWRPVNVTYLNKPIPLVWTDRRILLSTEEAGSFSYKVNRLMKVSCGGLIGLSVVAVLIVALSVVVFFYPKKVNRVAPTLEESSAANLHRHVTNS